MGVGEWYIDDGTVVVAALLVFLYVGYRRGVQRELPTLFGLGAGWLLASLVGPGLAERMNRLYRSARFLVEDSLSREDPAAVWERIRALPDIVRTDTDAKVLALAVFVGWVGLVYIVTQFRCRGPANRTGQVLGALGGATNGLLFSRGVMLLTRGTAMRWTLPAAGLVEAAFPEGSGASVMVVLVVALLIAFGVYSAAGAHRLD